MARASTQTLLPLDTWAEILGIDPWSMNQCSYPFPKSAQCSDVLYQFPWIKDHLSREEVAEAIASAESMLAHELRYWPAPKYFVGETVQYPRSAPRYQFGYAGNNRGDWKSVELQWHKVISGGALNRTFIGTIESPELTTLDLDGDGVFETFQATITDAAIGDLTNPYELALYFPAAYRHGQALGETWRIRPITVFITGDTAVIQGHRTLLINPEVQFAADAEKLNPATDSNYVLEVDCYRVFTDTRSSEAFPYQGVGEWRTDPGCTQNCTFEVLPICLGQDINDMGRVYASYTQDGFCRFSHEPDRLSVNYVAGLPLVNGQMDDEMARIVTYLSVSLLGNEKCGCDRSNRIIAYWKQRVTRFEDDNGEGARAFSANPTQFPMTNGGQYALKRVKRMRDIEAVGL